MTARVSSAARVTAPPAFWVGPLRFDPSPVMSRRMAERLGGAATVVPGVATFEMLRVYPDILRHAAALGAKRRARRYSPTTGRPVPFIISR